MIQSQATSSAEILSQDQDYKQNVNGIRPDQKIIDTHKQVCQKQTKTSSLVKNIFYKVNSFKKPKKHNPLLIHQDIQEQQKVQNDNIRQQSNHSVLSLPPNIKQQALDIITHQQNQFQQAFQQIKPQVYFEIINSATNGNPLSKHVIYTIKGEDMHGRFFIKRKFSEFIALRKILAHRWPGSFVPGLKKKLEMKNQVQRQMSLRKILINFLVGLSYLKHIYYKQQVQLFLRSSDIQISEMFEQMPELKTSDLISRFQYAFGDQLLQIQGPRITQLISRFHKKLRKMIGKLQQMSKRALDLAESYDTQMKNLSKFGEVMKLYQHFSLAEFTQNNRQMTILVKDDDKNIQNMRQKLSQNPFYELFSLLQIQLIDARSFLDIIIAIDLFLLRRQQLQTQIMMSEKQRQQIQLGNNTIKTMTTRKNKQELLKMVKQRLRKLNQQKQQIIKIHNIVQNVTANNIIPTFKCRQLRKIIIKLCQPNGYN